MFFIKPLFNAITEELSDSYSITVDTLPLVANIPIKKNGWRACSMFSLSNSKVPVPGTVQLNKTNFD